MGKYEMAERLYALVVRFEERRDAAAEGIRALRPDLLAWANPQERDEFEALRMAAAGQ